MSFVNSALDTLLFVNDMQDCIPSKELKARITRELDFFFNAVLTDDNNFSDSDKHKLAEDFVFFRCDTGINFDDWTDKEFIKKCREVASTFIKLDVYSYRNKIYSLSFNMLKNITSEVLIKWNENKNYYMLKFNKKGEQWRRVYNHNDHNENWFYIISKDEKFYFNRSSLENVIFVGDEAITTTFDSCISREILFKSIKRSSF